MAAPTCRRTHAFRMPATPALADVPHVPQPQQHSDSLHGDRARTKPPAFVRLPQPARRLPPTPDGRLGRIMLARTAARGRISLGKQLQHVHKISDGDESRFFTTVPRFITLTRRLQYVCHCCGERQDGLGKAFPKHAEARTQIDSRADDRAGAARPRRACVNVREGSDGPDRGAARSPRTTHTRGWLPALVGGHPSRS